MNTAKQLVDEVFAHGGRLWLENEQVQFEAPPQVIEPLLPVMREMKQEIAQVLQLEPRGRVFRVVVDGKSLTAIMPELITLAQAEDSMLKRFGAARVGRVSRGGRR